MNALREDQRQLHALGVKPLALIADAIMDCSKRGAIVLDAFAGSGSTLLAAERTGRKGYGIEIEPHYIDTIIKRFDSHYGLKAVHTPSSKSFEAIEAGRLAKDRLWLARQERQARAAHTGKTPGRRTTTPKTGFRNPPKHTQFRKGQSRNKKGRPQGSKNLSKEGVLESTPAENGARDFVQYIESCIEGSLSPAAANVTPSDKADLERALSALRPLFDELAKCFFNPVREQKPAVCEHGYYMLWSLMGAAFVAGSSGTMSEFARSYASRANALKSPRSQKKI